MSWWVCRTCAVESATRPEVCPVCADERQHLPAEGTSWGTLADLEAEGHRVLLRDLEPGLTGLVVEPELGIGQQALLVQTPAGALLWDPTGYVDDAAITAVRAHTEVVAVAASHPHMFGVQVEWARRLGGVPVLVAAADLDWVGRPDPLVQAWSGRHDVVPGLTLVQVGGHFPGSAVAVWAAGAEGRGVLLTGDSLAVGGDLRTVSSMRSYVNQIPLSAAVVQRIAATVEPLRYDRVYGAFGGVIDRDAAAAVRFSADRYAAWVRGDHDHLT